MFLGTFVHLVSHLLLAQHTEKNGICVNFPFLTSFSALVEGQPCFPGISGLQETLRPVFKGYVSAAGQLGL